MIVAFVIMQMLTAAMTIGFDPCLERYLKGHVDILHPLDG